MRAGPALRRCLVVRDEISERPFFGDVAEHRRVDFAVEQHLLQHLPRRRALHVGRLFVLGQMRVLERHPRNAAVIDAVVVRENAAHPHAGRLRVRANADAFAIQLTRRQRAALRVVEDRVVLTSSERRRGQQHVRLAVLESLQIGIQRNFAEVVLQLAHHRLEFREHRLHIGEVERHQW
jgi:hypothetical protein